jgi:hypothetical protein
MDTIPFPGSAELDRETRVQSLIERLRSVVDAQVRSMAESLVDMPADRIFGDIEFTLRDQAHQLAAQAHQIALDGDQKRATSVRAASAPAAEPMPDSSSTAAETC